MTAPKNKWIFIAALSIIIPILLMFLYSNSNFDIGVGKYSLFKSSELRIPHIAKKANQGSKNRIGRKEADTTKYRILLMGDSQTEALQKAFSDYCRKNGHQLALTFIYYNGSEVDFASGDTVANLIKTFQPTYIVFVIGLNELFVDDFDRRITAIKELTNKFGNIKYAWIGPANYAPDKGINDIFSENVEDGCFFLSKDLILERAKDGRHPSENGSRIWMDTIASWLTHTSKYPIRMLKPDSVYTGVVKDSILKRYR